MQNVGQTQRLMHTAGQLEGDVKTDAEKVTQMVIQREFSEGDAEGVTQRVMKRGTCRG